MITILSIAIYVVQWGLLLNALIKRQEPAKAVYFALIPIALALHFLAVYSSLVIDGRYSFAFFPMSAAFFGVINLVVFISSLRKPLHNLFLLLLPASILAQALAYLMPAHSSTHIAMGPAIATHILLSIFAYSLLTIATLQALLLDYQTSKLKTHHLKSLIGIFPPLQTMETLLFELLWVGFGILSLSIVTGVVFIENIFAQKLSHKLVFSVLSWAIYGALLWGRSRYGWRGKRAIRFVVAGFLMLMLAYFGSKFVIEFMLPQ